MQSAALESLSPTVRRSLAKLGTDIATARRKRNLTMVMMAERIGAAKTTYLKVEKGDHLFLTDAPDGGFRLTPYDPEFERQMEAAETIMREDREILRVLAK